MRLLTAISALTILFAPSVSAQIGNPAGLTPGTPQSAPGTPAPHQPNTQDRLFARLATAGGMAEVELGELAEQKAQSSSVKEFARLMTRDHRMANEQLASLARQANIPLPGDPDQEHKAMRSELENISGRQFDLAYLRGQIVDHQKTVQLLEWEINSGQDGDLQRFASETLPTVLMHLQMAQNLLSELTGQAPQGAAPIVSRAITGSSPENGGATGSTQGLDQDRQERQPSPRIPQRNTR